MPLLIHAVAWWIAGLLSLGLGLPAAPWCLSVGALAALAFRRRWEALLAPVAIMVSYSAAAERRHCDQALAASLRTGGAVWLHFDDVAQPPDAGVANARRPVRARGTAGERRAAPRCVVRATVQFLLANGGQALPRVGQRAEVHGAVLVTAQGLRITASTPVIAYDRASTLVAWRAHLARTIDRVFRQRRALVRALLIADQQGIDAEVRDRYADAGLVHLLSVSGMHVGIIAGALLTLGGALRVPSQWVEPLAMLVVAAYVALLGCPAPAVRSAVMLMVVALSTRLQRPVHEWTALALGASLPTVDPLVVHDLGWQLSVGGMAALVAARAIRRRWASFARRARPVTPAARLWCWLGTRRGAAGWLVGEISTGVIATLVTLPVIAWTFGRVSLVAPFSNLLAGPIVALLQPSLFLALLWALLVPASVASLLPDATQPMMALLDLVAAMSAAVPGAVLPIAPTWVTAAGGGVAAALVVRGTAARHGTRWYVGAAAVGVLTLWAPLLPMRNGTLELHMLDVGQGDALALRTPRGRWLVVDAGRRWDGGDAGRRTVVPYIRRRGGDVALFVLTHPHDDHAGGAASLVRAVRPAMWWEPAFVTASPGYRDALDAVATAGTRWERVRPGRRLALDGVTLEVLAPDSAWTVGQHDANETSVVLRVQYGRHRLLLTGDAERDEEAWLVAHYGADELAADVLKLGHHGSRTSSTAALLDAVAPRLALASVGAGNRYGHPAPETLAALLHRGVTVLRTDLEGTVIVRSDGRELSAEAGGERWIIP